MTTKLQTALKRLIPSLDYTDTVIETASGAVYRLSESDNQRVTMAHDCVICTASIPGYSAVLTVSVIGENALALSASFNPDKDVTDRIRRVVSYEFTAQYGADTRVLHQSFLYEGIHALAEMKEEFISEHRFALYSADDPDFALTFETSFGAKFYSEIAVKKQNESTVSLGIATVVPFTFEGEVVCQQFNLYSAMPLTEALERNAKAYGTDKPFENPIGWSTWDYYFTSATEDDVKEQTDFIAADPVLSKKVQYIALDDGWQQREGDWRSGCRFPSGLKSLVDYIKKKGFRAGIWVAPTRLHNLCGTVMRRNSFLVRNEYGDPVGDADMYMLDPTHPDGEKFLRETFSYLADCGFTFYKLDFISNVFKMPRFYDKNAGPYDALRRLFEIVRETVPEGSHIMGCSLPYGIGEGWVDSRRSGLDIHNTWKHIIECTEGYLPQFASNGKIYRLDLDYLVVRGNDTANDEMHNVLNPGEGWRRLNPTPNFRWRDGPDFNYNEAKVWCGIELMAGSSVFLGDKLTVLNERGLDLVRRTVENADFETAVPVIDGSPSLPEVWINKKTGRVFIFNFGDSEKLYTVDVENSEFTDIFTDEKYTAANGVLSETVKPHDCLCLVPGKRI